ncbi:MAG: hypothetical protein HYV77_03255 [Candidatus Wildermuthbacteria bacterium]|nr:hypothetical protein [Candidatus Wildermuthbacteria bacterium]
MNRFDALAEFEKEFKRLSKKYKTLDDDFEKFKKLLLVAPTGVGKNFVIIHSTETINIVKARMACRALRDRSLRIIYAYHVAASKVEFIEIYFKGEKENEDRERIKEYLKNQNPARHPI